VARDRVLKQFEAYSRAMTARWAVAPKARMTFLLWFSRGEQVLRYHGVKDNLFAHEPDVPERLLTTGGAYRAYLLENVMPGRADARPKSAARLLATEGFVGALFYGFLNTAVVALWRHRSPRRAGVALTAWALASLVAALAVVPL
jgi:hypothetical protein